MTDRFCTCGENVSAKTSIDDNGKKDIRTFDDYMLLNSKKKRFPVSSFKKVNDKIVIINVGIIRAAEYNELSRVKGSTLPVQVRRGFDADQVLKSTVKKHADYEPHFCDIESCCLVYSNMSIVAVAPGRRHKFTVKTYKDELGRPYSKMDLHLCKVVNAEKNCASENWFDWVINPNAIYENKISTEKFFRITLTNQDGKLELDSPTNYETCIRSEILENTKPATVTLTDPIVSTKHMDSNEDPIASSFSTPKISKAQSIYYSTFQTSIDISPTFSPIYVGTKVFCPVCSKRFFVKEIEEHADVYLMRKTERNIIYINNDSDAEDTTIYRDVNGNDSDKSDTTDTNSQFLSKIKSVLKSTIFNNGEAKLNIRCRFSFVDFCNFFSKIWNKPKLNMMYRVRLNGEARQDDGGLSREFYSGIRTCNGVCEHLMAFDTNILLPS